MKALTKIDQGYDNMELREIEQPSVYDDMVKIKVAYTGICGTDIHTFKGEYANAKIPIVLGHEFSGEVVEIGPEVKNVKVGNKVVSETTFETCGECIYCEEKDYNLCGNRRGIGTQVAGSMAEYVLSREESVHVVADHVTFEAASLMEPLACCVHAALEKTTIEPSDTVLIVGPGPIGLLLAQVVKAKGATVIMSGITKDVPRLNLAKELGVDYTVDTQTEDLAKVVMDATNGYGAEKVFDCSGVIHAVNAALPLTKKKGQFVQVGIFAEQFNKMDHVAVVQREIEFIGCRSQKPSSWIAALAFLEAGKIDTDKMITKIVSLDGWREGFEAVMSGNEIKVLIKS